MCLKYEEGLAEDCEQEGVDQGMSVTVVCKRVICVGWVSKAIFF